MGGAGFGGGGGLSVLVWPTYQEMMNCGIDGFESSLHPPGRAGSGSIGGDCNSNTDIFGWSGRLGFVETHLIFM